jgi:hypothetical protein
VLPLPLARALGFAGLVLNASSAGFTLDRHDYAQVPPELLEPDAPRALNVM